MGKWKSVRAEVKLHNELLAPFINWSHRIEDEVIRLSAALQDSQARLAKLDLGLEVSDAALAELGKVGFDPVYGARPLKRAIQSEIENPLAKSILEGRFAPKDTIYVDSRGGRMVFEKTPKKAAA